jgi:hypothetical protein
LHPARLRTPDEPVVGAEAVNALLREWRAELAAGADLPPEPIPTTEVTT